MLDLPIQFISPDEVSSSAVSVRNTAIDPDLVDFDQLPSSEQKALVLHLIELAILDIENQHRCLTEWEADTLSGATYQVPMEVPHERQVSLALRWLVDYADGRKAMPMRDALSAEILDAYNNTGNAVKKRDDMHKMAQANRAFAHYRW